jgi:6-pyruvoyl-tetrahydropterin synthase-like protein
MKRLLIKTVGTTTESENPIGEIEPPRKRRRLKRHLALVLLCAGVSAIAVIPFFFMGRSENGERATGLRMPTTHDMFLHYDQMRSFYEGLRAGEVYPRWEADTNRGFGAPTTSYYPPGVYYVTAAMYEATGDWVRGLALTQLLMMMGSGAAMYVYGRRVMSRWAAAAAMMAYVAGPYHLIDQYQRGAIAELMGFIFMPLMMWGAEELMEGKASKARIEDEPASESESSESKSSESKSSESKSSESESKEREASEGRRREWGRRMRGIAVLGASYGGFVWTHPPTAYQFSLGIGIYVLMMSVSRREWKGLVRVGLGMMLGLGLAAAYILPAAVEQDFISKEYITTSWPYHNTYVFVHQLFNYDSYADFFKRIDAMWILGSLVIAIAGTALLMFRREAAGPDSRLRLRVILWIILGCFASFMMHKVSRPIGELIPKIEIGVFTWRMLAITTLVVSLLTGACAQVAIQAMREKQKNTLAVCSSLCMLILIGGALFSVAFVVAPVTRAAIFVPEEEHMNPAMVPTTAAGDIQEWPDDAPPAELAEDNGEAVIERWEPEHRVIRVDLYAKDQLWIRTFNFPGWTATVDGRPAQIRTGEELADIQIDMEPGSHEARLDFLDTPIRRKSEKATIASFVLLIAIIIAPLFARPQAAESAR